MFAVEEYAKDIKAIAYSLKPPHMEQEDAEQELAIRCWRRWHTYNPERGAVGSWIFLVAKHTMADSVRHWKRQCRNAEVLSLNHIVEESDLYEFTDTLVAPEVDMAMRVAIRDALRTMPLRWRIALYLRYWRDLPYAEIARRFGVYRSRPLEWERCAFERLRKILSEAV